MIRHWRAIHPLLEAHSPRVVVEVGVFKGAMTGRLLEHVIPRDGTLHAIDPVRHELLDLEGLKERYGDRFAFHESLSLAALPEIRDADAVLLDGDHNWYTVYNELKTLAAVASDEGRQFPLTLMHDVDWPYGRRDLYYLPDTVPEEFRQPYAHAGLVPGHETLADGAGLDPRLAHAIEEGTPRNGVRTALEDFLADTDFALKHVDVVGFHGLAIVVDASTVERNETLRGRIEELDSSAWLREQCRRIEHMRLHHYTKLTELRRGLRQPGV